MNVGDGKRKKNMKRGKDRNRKKKRKDKGHSLEEWKIISLSLETFPNPI